MSQKTANYNQKSRFSKAVFAQQPAPDGMFPTETWTKSVSDNKLIPGGVAHAT
jgi:hypothetical protein